MDLWDRTLARKGPNVCFMNYKICLIIVFIIIKFDASTQSGRQPAAIPMCAVWLESSTVETDN